MKAKDYKNKMNQFFSGAMTKKRNFSSFLQFLDSSKEMLSHLKGDLSDSPSDGAELAHRRALELSLVNYAIHNQRRSS